MSGRRGISWPLRAAETSLRVWSRVAPTGRGAYRLMRGVRRLYRQDQLAGTFDVSGNVMRLDLSAYPDCTMAFGLYELETARAIRSLLRPGDTFIDLGANIGYFSLMAASAVGATGAVHSFEPIAANRARLQSHVQANALGGIVHVHSEAVGDHDGTLALHVYTGSHANHGQSTAFPRAAQSTQIVQTPLVTIDSHLPGIRPRLIKLDIEGSELAALRGMSKTLREARPGVIVEFNPVTFEDAGFAAQDIVSLLLDAVPQYTCTVLRWPVREIAPAAASLSTLGEVNLLFDLPPSARGRAPS